MVPINSINLVCLTPALCCLFTWSCAGFPPKKHIPGSGTTDLLCPREINASLGGGGRPAGSGEGQSAASGAAGACAGAGKTGAAVQAKGVEAFWGKDSRTICPKTRMELEKKNAPQRMKSIQMK